MDSTLMVSSYPFELRALNGENSLASNQLASQWGGTYSLSDGLMAREQESLPPSAGIFGGNDVSLRCMDGTMAGLDAGRCGTSTSTCGDTMSSTQLSDPFYAQTARAPPRNSSPGSISSSLPEEMGLDSSQSSDPPSPRTKPTPSKKRGRPRKTQATASTAIVDGGINTRISRQTSARSAADASGGEDPKAVRVREKNRIAADNCRSRRRQEKDKFKSRHDYLEQEHRRLLGALSELMAETFVLKNMLMEHGSCDCRLIQDYLKESESEWVAKKLKTSISPVGAVGASPS
ncbi:hypothetical protein PLICBS_010172 [Purpureocillium lilacinum]|uniref:uncharacterized protein n=1 Tax=Purpureocillium lilacinum TaxID=33203 RepID=UPI0020896954|nr:hypothetical protein PLICBS_010172 [Purpureocillium lilacinum]